MTIKDDFKNDDEFLYALREDMPREFGKDLYHDLTQQERVMLHKPKRSMLTTLLAAAAALILVLFGLAMVAAPRSDSPLAQPTPFSLNELAPITVENAANLTKLMTLGNGAVADMAWSPDGRTIAIATSRGLYLHDSGDLNAAPRLLGNQQEATGSIFYDESGAAIIGARDNAVWMWNVQTGEVLQKIDIPTLLQNIVDVKENRVAVLSCTPQVEDNRCPANQLSIWDLETGEETTVIQNIAYMTQLTPDLSTLVTFEVNFEDYNMDTTVKLIDMDSGEEFATVQGDFGAQAFVVNNELLVVPSANADTKVYRLDALRADPDTAPELTFKLWEIAQTAALSPDGSTLFVTGNKSFYSLDGEQKTHILRLAGLTIRDAVFSPDGNILLTMGSGSQLRTWDVATGEPLQTLDTYDPYYLDTAFSPDDSVLAASPNEWNGGLINLFDLSAESPVQTQLTAGGNGVHVQSLGRFAPQGKTLLYFEKIRSGSSTGVLYFYDPEAGGGDGMRFTNIGSSNQEGYLFDFADDGTRLRFLTSTGAVTKALEETDARTQLTGVAGLRFQWNAPFDFNPDGSVLAAINCIDDVTTRMGCVRVEGRLWDTQTGETIRVLEGVNYMYSPSMVFSADGNYLASSQCETSELITRGSSEYFDCTGYRVLVWDMSDLTAGDEPLAPFAVLEGFEFLPEIALSPVSTEGQLILAAADYETLQVFEVHSGERLIRIENESPNLTFSHDGTMIAIGKSGLVELWGVTPD